MDKKKSAKLLLIASIMMIIAAIIFILIKIFDCDAYSGTISIIFFVCAVLYFCAMVNFKKSDDKK